MDVTIVIVSKEIAHMTSFLYNTLTPGLQEMTDTLDFAKDQPTLTMRSVAVIIHCALDFKDHGHLWSSVMVDNELFSLPHYSLADAVKDYSMYRTLPPDLQNQVLEYIKY